MEKYAYDVIQHELDSSYKIKDYENNTKSALFVSVYTGKTLHGCIGTMRSNNTIKRNIEKYAKLAAFNDIRFEPIKKGDDFSIEISLIKDYTPIDISKPGWKNYIILGIHGIDIYLEDGKSAVFLPQVPIEQGWDINKTLEELKKKAGNEDGNIVSVRLFTTKIYKY